MYTIEVKTLGNGRHEKEVPVITFHEPEMAIVSEFLMTDAHLLNFQVLEDMNQVLLGESESIESSGQRTLLEIKQDVTVIKDLFVGVLSKQQLYETFIIKTVELKELIEMWRDQMAEYSFNG